MEAKGRCKAQIETAWVKRPNQFAVIDCYDMTNFSSAPVNQTSAKLPALLLRGTGTDTVHASRKPVEEAQQWKSYWQCPSDLHTLELYARHQQVFSAKHSTASLTTHPPDGIRRLWGAYRLIANVFFIDSIALH